jgi:hypothetical protein
MSQHEPVIVSAPPALSLKLQMIDNAGQSTEHENEWYNAVFSPGDYAIQEHPIHTPRPMHILIIGAGAAGLQIA